MSGVYINMEMPKSCPCELLGVGYDLICSFVGGIPCRVKEYYECCQNGTRPSWCPLVPVPPHGRLIAEADAVETTWMILRWLGYLKEENPKLEQTVREVFATAPAIEVEEHG